MCGISHCIDRFAIGLCMERGTEVEAGFQASQAEQRSASWIPLSAAAEPQLRGRAHREVPPLKSSDLYSWWGADQHRQIAVHKSDGFTRLGAAGRHATDE